MKALDGMKRVKYLVFIAYAQYRVTLIFFCCDHSKATLLLIE